MNRISTLLVIDTEGALASNSLMKNAYMVDTNGYLGSWNEGTSSLHTVCEDGQIIVWSAIAVSPAGSVSIESFSGDMVTKGICNPVPQSEPGEEAWVGRVETRGAFASYTYSIAVSVGGRIMPLSAYVKVA